MIKRIIKLRKSKRKEMTKLDFRKLLGRRQINLDINGIENYIADKTVLVTGGGGSIGSEICRQIAEFNPKKLLILDRYENTTYQLQIELERKFSCLSFQVIIASINNMERINNIFQLYKPEAVFHAAAYKHVPLMEANPIEAIENNIFGTLNLIESADRHGTKKFVFISTDKAVNPASIMGATKRAGEILIQAAGKTSSTEFVAVRFGNVLGSSGSVVPIFMKQIQQGGPVTITHPEITRYFMLIEEAVQLVLDAGALAKGGEIFVLDMGNPINIYRLACKLIKSSGLIPHKDIKIKFTGLRPGEKLHEELLMKDEEFQKTKNEKIFIVNPSDWNIENLKSNLDILKKSMKYGNEKELLLKLKEIVPNYAIKSA